MLRSKFRILLPMIGLVVIMVALSGQQISRAGPSLPNTAVSVDQVKGLVDFPVRTATKLPFQALHSLAFAQEVTPGVMSVEVSYVSPKGDSITVTTTTVPVTPVSDMYELKQVSLSKGRSATFMDNGTAQILNWNDGTTSYQVVGIRKSGSYSVQDLIGVAESLE